MKHKLLYLLILSSSLMARENPFFPIDGVQELSYTTNKVQEVAPLKQAAISFPNTARRIKKVTIEYQNLDGAIEEKYIDLDYEIDWHLPIFISQSYGNTTKDKNRTSLGKKLTTLSFNFTNFTFYRKKISIKTNDALIRDFMLTNPQRIVVDFKREASFLTINKVINKSVFKTLAIGNHNGYYRCVLTLDGQYKYSLQENKNSLDIIVY